MDAAGARAATYHALLEQEKAAGRFEAHKPFLRGGIWRNFMSRYPEANWMHKRMLGASRRLAALPPEQRSAELQEYLHRAQANDAYWHGLFGGLYLPHLRRAIWNNLLKLEAALEHLAPWPRQQQGDLDHDGHIETALRNPFLHAYVRDDGHASLVEFSSLAVAHNFGDTLRAYAEAYHAKIDLADARGAGGNRRHRLGPRPRRLPARHPARDADPDERPRGIFLDAWSAATTCCANVDFYRPATSPALGPQAARAGASGRATSSRRHAERQFSAPKGGAAGPDRNRAQPRPAQLRRLRRPLCAGRRQRSRRLRRGARTIRRACASSRWTTASCTAHC
jgi:hypothetical protein